MSKQAIFLSFFLLCMLCGEAQSQIRGMVTDTLNNQQLGRALIMLLRNEDSVLVDFTRTTDSGFFEMNGLPGGQYLLVAAYPKYADFIEKITLLPGEKKDLGTIPLLTQVHLLTEVIVRQRIPAIRIKGDTTEFKADSFYVSPNADVQELLKKLPGMQVDMNGQIKFHGERVSKMLVDGEEFFSDDPGLVAKTIRAEMVDKVQAYDAKSEQAKFTGIDDGQKITTVNLKLKEDKKQGYFGKAEAGTDLTRHYSDRLMANSFKAKGKTAAYVSASNTSFESLNNEESSIYGGDMNTGDIDNFDFSSGLPASVSGGLHWNTKWGRDRQKISNTYQFNNQHVNGNTIAYTRSLVPGNAYTDSAINNQVAFRTQHQFTSMYDLQLDSFSSVSASVGGAISDSHGTITANQQTWNEQNALLNTSQRELANTEDNRSFSGSIYLKKRLKKSGRTLSIGTQLRLGNRSASSQLNSVNAFYSNGTIIQHTVIDQFKPSTYNRTIFNADIGYTEPLWGKSLLSFNYNINNNVSKSNIDTYEKGVSGKYDTPVDSLSNHFVYNLLTQSWDMAFHVNTRKINLSIGSGIGPTSYDLLNTKSTYSRHAVFMNATPGFDFKYSPKISNSISFHYSGYSINPLLQQIQPITDNSNPLYMNVGNENLRQGFAHLFGFRTASYKMANGRSISFSANYSFLNNAIVSSNTLDSLGRRVSSFVNTNGNYYFNTSISYQFPSKTLLRYSAYMYYTKNRHVDFVNSIRNINDYSSLNIWGDISGSYKQWWSYVVSLRGSMNQSQSTINPDAAITYWTLNPMLRSTCYFVKPKIYLDFDFNAYLYQANQTFKAGQDRYIMNVSLKKPFTKSNAWEVKLTVSDLFNQNTGFNRSIETNFYSEVTNTVIRRYFLFSITYNFTKYGKVLQ